MVVVLGVEDAVAGGAAEGNGSHQGAWDQSSCSAAASTPFTARRWWWHWWAMSTAAYEGFLSRNQAVSGTLWQCEYVSH